MKKFYAFSVLIIMLLALVACAAITPGATNTTATNVGVTSYEAAGASLTQAFNLEKALLKAGAITADQDKDFQLGPYAKAVNCYKAIGSEAVSVLTATDALSQGTAQDKFNALNAQLPGLIANVTNFIQEVSK